MHVGLSEEEKLAIKLFYSNKLFIFNNKPADGEKIRAIFYQRVQHFLPKHCFGWAQYRHISTAFMFHYLAPLLDLETALTDDIFDEQAGHTSEIARIAYAHHQFQLGPHDLNQLTRFWTASTSWQNLICIKKFLFE